MRQSVFRESQQDDTPQCAARYQGCLGDAVLRMQCSIEGAVTQLCSHCMDVWRLRVLSDTRLALRCPRCAEHVFAQTGGAAPAAARSLPLEGTAAVAIEDALRREGITQDVRRRVLVRLREEAPWIDNAYLTDPHEVAADEDFLRRRASA